MKIYTKTGDKGETGLFGGKRVPKNHARIEAYGTVDELNSYIGLVRDSISNSDTAKKDILKQIQDCLFTIGAKLAADPDKHNLWVPDILDTDISLLETAIDTMDADLPPLKNFILPGGHLAVSHTHVARCVCRRAERLVVSLSYETTVEEKLIQYLNRLSDYLFVLARQLSKDFGAEEIVWKSK
jgi:cob(I)alamin adenosyltransferase